MPWKGGLVQCFSCVLLAGCLLSPPGGFNESGLLHGSREVLGHGRGVSGGSLRDHHFLLFIRHFGRVCAFFPLKNALASGTLQPGHLLFLGEKKKTSVGFFTCSEKLD